MDKAKNRVIRIAVVFVALLPLAGTAHAADHSKTFYTNAPAFGASDSNGTFDGQINYTAPGFPMQWSFDIKPSVEAIAVSPMDCTAGLVQPDPPYHDSHLAVPVTYTWHSTVTGTPLDRLTDLWGNCRFNVNVGGRPGVADLKFAFHYTIHNGPIGAHEEAEKPSLETKLDIRYTR